MAIHVYAIQLFRPIESDEQDIGSWVREDAVLRRGLWLFEAGLEINGRHFDCLLCKFFRTCSRSLRLVNGYVVDKPRHLGYVFHRTALPRLRGYGDTAEPRLTAAEAVLAGRHVFQEHSRAYMLQENRFNTTLQDH